MHSVPFPSAHPSTNNSRHVINTTLLPKWNMKLVNSKKKDIGFVNYAQLSLCGGWCTRKKMKKNIFQPHTHTTCTDRKNVNILLVRTCVHSWWKLQDCSESFTTQLFTPHTYKTPTTNFFIQCDAVVVVVVKQLRDEPYELLVCTWNVN